MMLETINKRIERLRIDTARSRVLLELVRPHVKRPEEGVTLGVKLAPDIRAHMEEIQKAYGFSTHRETVMTCILVGAEVLLARLSKESGDAKRG